MVRFGRHTFKQCDQDKRNGHKRKNRPGTFNFLGFTHYCTKSRNGKFKVGRKTEKKRFTRGIRKVKKWLKSQRSKLKLKEIWEMITQILSGHYRYYGVNENYRQLANFYYQVKRTLYKWVNRRSQKRSFTWEKFGKYMERYPLPLPRIYYNLPKYAKWMMKEAAMKSRMRENFKSGSVREGKQQCRACAY
jgi:hypothetical protein